jgi:hypothetical protein
MDEILTFIIIWVVLYLINLVSKKLKKQQTGQSPATPTPPVTQRPQPSVLDSRGLETMSQFPPEDQSEDFETDEAYFEEEEELVEQEIITKMVKRPEVSVAQPSEDKESFEEFTGEIITSPQRPQMTLKQYIIWKEILDKPLSMRNRRQISKNRVS